MGPPARPLSSPFTPHPSKTGTNCSLWFSTISPDLSIHVSPSHCLFLQGRKSNLKCIFKTLLKPPSQVRKYIFFQRTFLILPIWFERNLFLFRGIFVDLWINRLVYWQINSLFVVCHWLLFYLNNHIPSHKQRHVAPLQAANTVCFLLWNDFILTPRVRWKKIAQS